MGKIITWAWSVAGAALSAVVVLGFLVVVATWTVGVRRNDEDLTHHGLTSLLFLAAYLPWFVPHYVVRPSLAGLLVPVAGVVAAPFLLMLLLLFTMETPGATIHVRTVVMATGALAPVAGSVWFVARCRRRWARLVALADEAPGGRVAEVVEVARAGPWRRVRLVDVHTGEREEIAWWGYVQVGEVCVVDGAMRLLARAAPIVRGLGGTKPPPATLE
ncbi:hypothetical protein [Oerskovia turbata]